MRRFLSMAVVSSTLGAVVALDGLRAGAELRHRRAERAEVVHHRLVDEHVAVGEEEDALLAAGLPQPPDDLEGGVGLAGAGRHDEQDAVLALGDGLDRRVDGVDLVVARGLAAAVVEIVLKDDLLRFRRQALPGAIAAPRDRSGDGKASSARLASFSALVPVRSWNTKPSPFEEKTKGMLSVVGVVERLLHAVADAVVVVLGLDERDRDVGLVVEDVVGALGLAARDQLAANDDAALGEADLLADLQHLIPARLLHGGRDELGADVAFAEGCACPCRLRKWVIPPSQFWTRTPGQNGRHLNVRPFVSTIAGDF